MMRPFEILRFAVLFAVYIVAAVALWDCAVHVFGVPKYLISAPEDVFGSLISLRDYYSIHFWTNFCEAVIGLIVAVSGGVIAAFIVFYGGLVGRTLTPLLVASQAFPREALAPLLVIALGFGMASKITIAALIAFFPIAVNSLKGLAAVPERYLDLLRVSGASPWQMLVLGRLPFAAPYFLAALRMATLMSVIGAVVGEFVGGGGRGLGYVILSARTDFATERVFAALLLLWLLSGAFYVSASVLENVMLKRFATGGKLT